MKRANSFLFLLALLGGAAALYTAPDALAGKERDDRAHLTRTAAHSAEKARKALASHNAGRAIRAAEKAVGSQPQSAEYRALLGEAYLAAGRFTSAGTAFADALALQPDNDRAAFKLALVRIAQGDAAAARDLIDVRRSALPPEDYALARALAGDTEGATEILETAIRAGEANVRTRQNLAFIYALSGRWVEARTMAGLDMAPNAVSDRIGQWAMLVRSGAEKERVAMLLGVTPVIDPGQPHQLARRSETPLEEPTVSADAAAASSTYVAEAAPAEAFSASTLPAEPSATYEVDPALKDPAPLRMAPKPRTSAGAFKAAATSPLSGRIARQWESSLGRPVGYVVQLGAFRTAQGAASGWQKIKARHGALRRMDGRQAQVRLGQGVFYRLSVALNSRGQAQALCQSMRGQGSPCFVRTMSSGDMVRWAAPLLRRPSQLALRQRAPISRAGDRPSS